MRRSISKQQSLYTFDVSGMRNSEGRIREKILVHGVRRNLLIEIRNGQLIVHHAVHGSPILREYVYAEIVLIRRGFLLVLATLLLAEQACHEVLEHSRRQIID